MVPDRRPATPSRPFNGDNIDPDAAVVPPVATNELASDREQFGPLLRRDIGLGRDGRCARRRLDREPRFHLDDHDGLAIGREGHKIGLADFDDEVTGQDAVTRSPEKSSGGTLAGGPQSLRIAGQIDATRPAASAQPMPQRIRVVDTGAARDQRIVTWWVRPTHRARLLPSRLSRGDRRWHRALARSARPRALAIEGCSGRAPPVACAASDPW